MPTAEAAEKAEEAVAAYAAGTMLFTTKTCPNCRVAMTLLDKEGVGYEKLLAEENAEACAAFGVNQAPTLVVSDGVSFKKYTGVSDIRAYLREIGA